MASKRAGFTLVELLIVIAIIALLGGVTLVAMQSARLFVGATTARHRLDDLSQALEIYKQKYGEYPPDCCASDAEIQRHILKRWPNALKGGNVSAMVVEAKRQMGLLPFYPGDTEPEPNKFRRPVGCALLYWLAGSAIPSPVLSDDPEQGKIIIDYQYVPQGFSTDKNEPIVRRVPSKLPPLGVPLAEFEAYLEEEGFTKENLDEPGEEALIELKWDEDGAGNGNVNNSGLVFKGNPILYFRASGKDGYVAKEIPSSFGVAAAPYMKNGQWYMPESFQLIYPGDDGEFGVSGDLGDPSTISPADKDNVTNFTGGATIDSEIE